MKVLMVGSDRLLFQADSKVGERLVMLGQVVDELHIIVFALGRLHLQAQKLANNVWVYPTDSLSRWCYVWDAIRRFDFSRQGIDWVTAQDPFESGLAGWLLARRLGAKLQLQIHTDFLHPYFRRESFLNKIRLLLAKFLLPRADSVRVVSQRIADSLKAEGHKPKVNPTVLPVFIDIEKLRVAPVKVNLRKKYPQFDKIILMASRLTREKDIGLAIEAMREVIKRLPKTGLIIVGSGPEGEKLKRQSEKHGLRENVIFEEWTTELSSYYKTVDLFLNTSLYEGYGRTIIEALACGCSVISTDVGIAREAGAVIADKNTLAITIVGTLDNGRPPSGPLNAYLNKAAYLAAYSQSWLNK